MIAGMHRNFRMNFHQGTQYCYPPSLYIQNVTKVENGWRHGFAKAVHLTWPTSAIFTPGPCSVGIVPTGSLTTFASTAGSAPWVTQRKKGMHKPYKKRKPKPDSTSEQYRRLLEDMDNVNASLKLSDPSTEEPEGMRATDDCPKKKMKITAEAEEIFAGPVSSVVYCAERTGKELGSRQNNETSFETTGPHSSHSQHYESSNRETGRKQENLTKLTFSVLPTEFQDLDYSEPFMGFSTEEEKNTPISHLECHRWIEYFCSDWELLSDFLMTGPLDFEC